MEGNRDLEFSVVGRHETFDGDTNLSEFLRSFEERAELEEWDGPKKRRMLVSLCKGAAANWLRCTPNLMDQEYETLKIILEKRFKTEVTPAEAYVRLMNIKLGNGTMSQYAKKLETLVAEYQDVIPELSQPATRDALMIKFFRNGLPPRYQALTIASAATEYTELLQSAYAYERSFEGSRKTVGALATDCENDFHNGQYDRYDRGGDTFGARERNFTPASRQSANETYYASNQGRFRDAPTCYSCGKTGHVQRYCRGRNQANRGGYDSYSGYSYQNENWRATNVGNSGGSYGSARDQGQASRQNGGWRTPYSRGGHQQSRGASFSKN